MKNILKIDKFYFLFAAVFVVLSIVVIFTLRTIFDGLNTANSIDSSLLKGDVVRVDRSKVEAAVNNIDKKEFVPLDLR